MEKAWAGAPGVRSRVVDLRRREWRALRDGISTIHGLGMKLDAAGHEDASVRQHRDLRSDPPGRHLGRLDPFAAGRVVALHMPTTLVVPEREHRAVRQRDGFRPKDIGRGERPPRLLSGSNAMNAVRSSSPSRSPTPSTSPSERRRSRWTPNVLGGGVERRHAVAPGSRISVRAFPTARTRPSGRVTASFAPARDISGPSDQAPVDGE